MQLVRSVKCRLLGVDIPATYPLPFPLRIMLCGMIHSWYLCAQVIPDSLDCPPMKVHSTVLGAETWKITCFGKSCNTAPGGSGSLVVKTEVSSVYLLHWAGLNYPVIWPNEQHHSNHVASLVHLKATWSSQNQSLYSLFTHLLSWLVLSSYLSYM